MRWSPDVRMSSHDATDDRQTALRAAVQEKIIECLNRFYSIETEMWGKPVDALIVRTVVQGRLQDRLYDLSALAHVLGLPMGTLHRKVADLVVAGYLLRERRGKSVYILPTEKTCTSFDRSFEDMVETLRRLYRNGLPTEDDG